MKRLSAFLVLAITLNVALGMTFRHKRQSDSNDNELEDRYGWDGQGRPRRPNQGNSWNQGGNPWNQGGDQWPQPNQGGNLFPQPDQGGNPWNQGGNQFPQQPNQGGNQWNQGGNLFPQPNQGGNQQPNQGVNQGNQPQTTPPTGTGTTTQSSAVRSCISSCPVTSEFNPVCGTNLVQYDNPGRLECARTCGVNVSLFRSSACPASTPAPAPAS